MIYLLMSALEWVADENICILFWFPGATMREEARKFLEVRGEILKEFRVPSSQQDVYGWMLYLYADMERPYVVDLRTVRNKSRKCGWGDGRPWWYIWVWRGRDGWAEKARGSSAPLKTFLRALGSGWMWSPGTEIPESPDEFSLWWGNLSARLGLTLEKWKSVLHIPDSMRDHPRIFALLFHRGTGDWFRRINWKEIYEKKETGLLKWLGDQKVKREEDIREEWGNREKIYFICCWLDKNINLADFIQ